jgi:hypothetical protein
MQITSQTPAVYAVFPPKAVTQKATVTPPEFNGPGNVAPKAIDFSHITPRQLHAYLDDRVMSGNIDGPEGLYCTTLFGSIPGEWYTERADEPMDLTATVRSIADFARDNGSSSLVRLYDGLLGWMKLMETQSVHISVVA